MQVNSTPLDPDKHLTSARLEGRASRLVALRRASERTVKEVWNRLRRSPHAVALGVIVTSFAALYAAAGVVEHMGFRTALYDLGIYDQALRAYAHFSMPHVPILGVSSADDPGTLHWADHFTPILVALAPLYWIHDGPATLLIAHGALFASAIVPIWLFARRGLGTFEAYVLAVAFGLSWPIQEAVWFPFHQVAFAAPLIGLLLERYQAGALRHMTWLAALLLTIREDLGLLISALGLLLVLRKHRRLGLALGVGGIFATWLITAWFIPLCGGSPHRDCSYWHLAKNPLELLFYLIKHPLAALEHMLTPAEKVRTLLWLLAPLAFIPCRSPLLLLAAPLLAVRFLSSTEAHWTTQYHYNAFLVPILFCAGIDGQSRCRCCRSESGSARSSLGLFGRSVSSP